MLVQKVDNRHQELAIVYFMFDSEGAESVVVQDIDNIWVLHVLTVQLPEDGQGSLPRDSFPWVFELFKQRMNYQVLGLLLVGSVLPVDEAEFKHLV